MQTENFVISFHSERIPGYDGIYKRLDKLSRITLTSSWILYAILDDIIGETLYPLFFFSSTLIFLSFF